jgi:membrane associated rhomboid family serine protease
MVAPAPASRPSLRIWPRNPVTAAVVVLTFTALLYLIEAVDVLTPLDLDAAGIVPRSLSGLDGVIWAPLLHGGWAHLLANTLPFVIFGFLALAGGIGQFIMVTATIWVLGGLGVWLTAPDGTVHIGMSGVIFGWLVFLLARGFFAGSWSQILLAVPLFLLWGGMLFGVLPSRPDISWQGHLFGALAGLLAAWLVARADRAPRSPGMIAG